METKVQKADDFRGMEQGRRAETAVAMRRRLLDIRMDIYTPSAQHGGEKRKIRRNLARLLTVISEEKNAAAKVAKTSAPKVVTAPTTKKTVKAAVKTAAPKTTKKSK